MANLIDRFIKGRGLYGDLASVASEMNVPLDDGGVNVLVEAPAPESPSQESLGSVVYDTLDFDECFNPHATYKLFCRGYRPGKCNLDLPGEFPGHITFDLLSLGVRVDIDGAAADDMLHLVLRSAHVTLYVGQKEWVHLPLALLYPPGIGHRPMVIQPLRSNEAEDPLKGYTSAGPYRKIEPRETETPAPPVIPTVRGAIEVETGPGGVELDELGRPPWLRGGFCMFVFLEPPVRIPARQSFYARFELSPSGLGTIERMQQQGLFKGELAVYLGGVRRRDVL